MRLIDACAREPTAQLGARAAGEWQTGGELYRARCLTDDHHAVARSSRDDRERAWDQARIDAASARADRGMQRLEIALHTGSAHVPYPRLVNLDGV